MNDLYKLTLNLVYLNHVTEYDRRYELVELRMKLGNSALSKNFNSNSRLLKNFNSNSTHFG